MGSMPPHLAPLMLPTSRPTQSVLPRSCSSACSQADKKPCTNNESEMDVYCGVSPSAGLAVLCQLISRRIWESRQNKWGKVRLSNVVVCPNRTVNVSKLRHAMGKVYNAEAPTTPSVIQVRWPILSTTLPSKSHASVFDGSP